ncbi:LolA family protein [Halomarina rubra]|uniref:Outer membrane lipoprotein carrier protein LolA n=1 Tax=Halomarina rubra TaxID=2071873 RepID=A0ABD6ART1_9EURY|nr:outer membrane lipoprotein carrier protein LolA [Halomarina rubra]
MSTGPVDEETVESYVQQFEQEMNDLDGFSATRTTTVTIDGETHNSTAKVWVRPGTGEQRAETLAPSERAGDLLVRTTNASWNYDVSENRAHRLDVSNSDLPTTNGFGYLLDDLVERSNVSYAGTEDLDGKTVHRIEFTPTDTALAGGNLTVWVDAETRFPVKLHQTVDTEELTLSTTIRYEDVELNPGIDDDRFTFDPPANATVEETDLPPMERYDSLDALRANVSTTVPTPDLPDGFELDRAVLTHLDDGDSLSMTFTNETATVTVGKLDAGVYGNVTLDGGESVAVGETTGTYRTYAEVGSVQWTCEEHRYSVGGSLSKAALLDLAESIACE